MALERVIEDYGEQSFCSVIQLRCGDRAKLIKVLEFVKSRTTAISKVTELREGYNVYLTRKGAFHKLMKEIIKHFGGTVQLTKRLVTKNRQSSKLVYRMYAALRLFEYSKGDVIVLAGEPCLVRSTGLKLGLVRLKDNKQLKLDYTGLKVKEKLQPRIAYVAQHSPELKLINPETYQVDKPVNKPNRKQEHYSVVIHKSRLYIVEAKYQTQSKA